MIAPPLVCLFLFFSLAWTPIALGQSATADNQTILTPLSNLILPPINAVSLSSARQQNDAETAIKKIQAQFAATDSTDQKDLLYTAMGLTAMKHGRLVDAETYFIQAHPESALLAPYLRLWLGLIANGQEKYDQAFEWLEMETKTGSLLQKAVDDARLASLIGAQKYSETNQWLAKKPEKARSLYFQGLIAQKRALKNLMRKTWRQLLVQFPNSEFETSVVSILFGQTRQIPQDFLLAQEWLLRARNLLSSGHPLVAAEIYFALNEQGLPHQLELADALFQSKNYGDAANAYQELWTSTPAGADKADILSRLTTSYARSNQFSLAIETNNLIAKLYPESEHGQQVPQKLAFLYFDAGDYKKARKAYSKLINDKNPRANLNSRWQRAWSQYWLGDYRDAQKDFAHLQKYESDKSRQHAAIYWQARVSGQLDEAVLANKLYQQLIKETPTGYYALLSEQRLRERHLKDKLLINPDKSILLPKPMSSADDGYAQFKIDRNDPLARALLLAQLGESAFAYDESTRSNAKVPATLMNMAGNYNDPVTGANGGAYPNAFEYWVLDSARTHAIPAELIWAVMKQESLFQPLARSPANAYGLMQIIPRTGLEIASALQVNNFQADDLYDPAISIPFGAYYLKRQTERFSGHLPSIIASYNAGPDAVLRWRVRNGKLADDEFIELIPYQETRKYVQKVFTNLWYYLALNKTPL